MKWKEFIKPTPKKLILAVLIFVFLPVFTHKSEVFCFLGEHCPPYMISYMSFLVAAYYGFGGIEFSFVPAVFLLFSYLLSCFLIYLFNRISSKSKDRIKEFLRPTKWKLIISVVFWTTVFSFILFYINYLFGGTMNLPFPIRLIYDSYFALTNILIFLAPIYLLSILFYSITSALVSAFIYFIGYPYGIGTLIFRWYVPVIAVDVGYLGVFEILVFILMMFYWYVISCTIVLLYDKFKKRSGK